MKKLTAAQIREEIEDFMEILFKDAIKYATAIVCHANMLTQHEIDNLRIAKEIVLAKYNDLSKNISTLN